MNFKINLVSINAIISEIIKFQSIFLKYHLFKIEKKGLDCFDWLNSFRHLNTSLYELVPGESGTIR